ncbi:hypothetical protein LOD99_13 [Oopsacas minuta]|uniref:Uncharacterized protein n=1 Tax=Oopsacas minuta TaxID=111878 RepID=A0AAV7KAG5_9METZ|nr:hypothetical protein LOD99_13 [Oopsacas minuta]
MCLLSGSYKYLYVYEIVLFTISIIIFEFLKLFVNNSDRPSLLIFTSKVIGHHLKVLTASYTNEKNFTGFAPRL